VGGTMDGDARDAATMSHPDAFADWTPYRPPWYPEHLPNPWALVSNMSDNRVTNYAKWVASLPPGEELRLIAAHRARVETGEG
jgi:hypothetical protein